MKTKTAMFAYSGDPTTCGHVDIISRIASTFDKVVVGIGVNADKKYMFGLDERMEMARRSLGQLSNVEVVSFEGLSVHYAYENGIDVIFKGVRNAVDFNYENNLHQLGESQKLGIETYLLFAKPELAHISSSAAKGMQKEQGLIHEYVSLYVKQCLEARISEQYIVGVTGEIGAGKSYVSRKFVELGKKRGIAVHNIELDDIGHQILGELKQPKYEEVRAQIAETFGQGVRSMDGSIDRKVLGEFVFNNPSSLEKLNQIMATPLLVRIRRELYGKKGLILFNAALIAESDMAYLCNNNVALVYANKKTQESRLGLRGLSIEQMQRRSGSQFDFQKKKNDLTQSIERDAHGNIWVIDNSDDVPSDDNIKIAFEDIVSKLGVPKEKNGNVLKKITDIYNKLSK